MNQEALVYIREESSVEKLVRSKLFWFLFLLLAFSYPIYRSVNRTLPAELPRLFKLPDYSLISEEGKPFGSKDLKGRLYIGSFMFTSCPTTCPGLMEKMKVVQKRVKGLGQKIALVSYSVDPSNDTPEVLEKYARRQKANPYVWKFVTGEKSKLQALLIDGFKVPMGDREQTSKMLEGEPVDLWDIVHSEKLALVDREGFVRGYYSTDKHSIDKLMIDVGLLVNRSYN